ncbi:MAG: O-antigen ligase family protein [Clostridia bacterium]|nr:O-antigen ligase family protein [Clostridia bacterium]
MDLSVNNSAKRTNRSYTVLIWLLFVMLICDLVEAPIPYEIYSFGTTVCCFLFIIFNNKYLNKKNIVYFGVFCICIFLSAFIHMSGIEDMCKIISFLSILLISSSFKIGAKTVKRLYYATLILGLALLLFAPLGDLNTTIIKGVPFLNEVNPNTSAFYMYSVAIISIVFAIKYKRKNRLLNIIIFSIATFGIVLFQSRTCLMSLLISLFFLILFKFIKGDHKTRFLAILAVLGILFAYFYAVILFDIVGGTGQVEIFGKDLFTGRQKIWQSAFLRLDGHYLFGIGNTLAEGSENVAYTSNIHNQFLSIMTIYGLPTVIMFILCLTKFINSLVDDKKQYYIILSVSISFILGCYFEIYLQMFRSMVCVINVFILIIGVFETGGMRDVKCNSAGV